MESENLELRSVVDLLGLLSGEAGVKPQYTQFTQYPHKTVQSDGLQWVTISYYEQSDIIN